MVIWTDPAKADLRRIFEYIAHDSRHYADKVTQEIVGKVDVLNDLHRIGRVVEEVGDSNVRELSVYAYRIIYELVGRDIYILAVVHKRRDLDVKDIER